MAAETSLLSLFQTKPGSLVERTRGHSLRRGRHHDEFLCPHHSPRCDLCDFKAVILEDCTMASSEKIHQETLGIYRKTALYPLLRVMASGPLLSELTTL